MDPTVCLLVFGISIASARHTLDVNRYLVQSQIDPNHSFNDQYSSQDVERRNIAYSNINSNQEAYNDAPLRIKQPVYSNKRNVDYSYVTESDHVALLSEKVDPSNNIGNDMTVFRLRTNAYPTKSLDITEFTTEPINEQKQRTHTHIDKQNVQGRHGDSELSAEKRSRTQNNNQRSTFNPRADHQRSLTMTPDTRLIPRETQATGNHDAPSNMNVRNHNDMHTKMNRGTAQSVPVENKNHVPETDVRPFEESRRNQSTSNIPMGSRGAEDSGRVPVEKDEEEIPWVWGTQPGTKVNTTEVDDLDDRAAFDGSPCATGYVKVMGVCVEKH